MKLTVGPNRAKRYSGIYRGSGVAAGMSRYHVNADIISLWTQRTFRRISLRSHHGTICEPKPS